MALQYLMLHHAIPFSDQNKRYLFNCIQSAASVLIKHQSVSLMKSLCGQIAWGRLLCFLKSQSQRTARVSVSTQIWCSHSSLITNSIMGCERWRRCLKADTVSTESLVSTQHRLCSQQQTLTVRVVHILYIYLLCITCAVWVSCVKYCKCSSSFD